MSTYISAVMSPDLKIPVYCLPIPSHWPLDWMVKAARRRDTGDEPTALFTADIADTESEPTALFTADIADTESELKLHCT